MHRPLQLSAQGGVGSVIELNLKSIINKDKLDSEYCASSCGSLFLILCIKCYLFIYMHTLDKHLSECLCMKKFEVISEQNLIKEDLDNQHGLRCG